MYKFRSAVMENVICPVVFNLYYKCGAEENDIEFLNDKNIHPVESSTPYIRNFNISGISSFKTKSSCGVFFGLPESPMENLVISDSMI